MLVGRVDGGTKVVVHGRIVEASTETRVAEVQKLLTKALTGGVKVGAKVVASQGLEGKVCFKTPN